MHKFPTTPRTTKGRFRRGRIGGVVAVGLLSILLGLRPSDARDLPQRVRRRSPIESNIFLGDWWDYYNRAIRRINQGDLAGGEADLREAIKFKPDDSANARTYGVRFQEYYPNLELGILLYEKGAYSEALSRLKSSLKTAPLLETKFYLHETYRQILFQDGSDTKAPSLMITEPPAGIVTRESSITVRGTATDDTFVDEIEVGGDFLTVPPMRSEVDFEWEVPLTSGINRIPVRVTDLVGHSRETEIVVTVDRQGPVLSLEKLEIISGKNRARLVSTVYDPRQIRSVTVNGRPVGIPPGQEVVPLDMEVELSADKKDLRIIIVDGLENQTIADLDPTMKKSEGRRAKTRVRVAAVGMDPRWFLSAVPRGPRIEIRDPKSDQLVYIDQIQVDGYASDLNGIKAIFVDGFPVDIKPGKELYFSHLAGPLEEGTNSFEFKAVNLDGATTSTLYRLKCELSAKPDYEQRLAVTIPAFSSEYARRQPGFAEMLHEIIFQSIVDLRRFNVADDERLSEVLLEREIAEKLGDIRFRMPDRSLTAADYVIDCRVIEREKTALLTAKVICVQTYVVDGVIAVYLPDKEYETIEKKAREFARKLQILFPSGQGEIFSKDPYLTTLSKKTGVRDGMQCIAMRKGKSSVLPSGKDIGAPTTQLGPMILDRVSDEYSYAKWVKAQSDGGSNSSRENLPQVGDIVVLR